MTYEDELAKRYEILEEVGHGGQARVVKARDKLRKEETIVALKIYDVAPRPPA